MDTEVKIALNKIIEKEVVSLLTKEELEICKEFIEEYRKLSPLDKAVSKLCDRGMHDLYFIKSLPSGYNLNVCLRCGLGKKMPGYNGSC